MKIGAFSVSLSVKDIKVSREFYEKIGFAIVQGNEDEKWLILRNESVTIGLFEGMFEKNMMTFNPGWESQAQDEDSFVDIRELQKQWKDAGIELLSEVEENTVGPGNFMLEDPDGNPILIDQHR